MTKILIIEDEKKSYMKITSSLYGYEFLPKENDFRHVKKQIQLNHNSACKCISQLIVDNYIELRCIICDIRLTNQDYDGIQVIREIINQVIIDDYPEYMKYIPIIVNSCYTDEETSIKAIDTGATLIIDKNAPSDYLRAVVNKEVAKFSALCDKYILKRPYKIGLTFTGENKIDPTKTIPHRGFVKEIANKLAFKYGVDSIFFDEFHAEKINGLKSDKKLNQVYKKQCDFIVVFLSKDYASDSNIWTGIEWKAVNEYAKEHSDKIILITLEDFDTTEISGISQYDIYKNEVNACAGFKDSLSQNKKDKLTSDLLDFLHKKIKQF